MVQAGEPENPIDLRADSPEFQEATEEPEQEEVQELQLTDPDLENWYSMNVEPEEEVRENTTPEVGVEPQPVAAEQVPVNRTEQQPASRTEPGPATYLESHPPEISQRVEKTQAEPLAESSTAAAFRILQEQITSQNKLLLSLLAERQAPAREVELQTQEKRIRQEHQKGPQSASPERTDSADTGAGPSQKEKRVRPSPSEREASKQQKLY